ncbi:2-oxo-4-hydroxy-4-carboxy-5-ureidoimidazoline decarboxylase [Mesobacillus maritimus]|uniref:2-oxo-4-hydroxy-4-carboxy-5-ureidoimidazoline decarboxylase n=1 Tax=Mesobacillus maritimus TaxID=1643336 RepID=A0ABS7K0S2_9BACI|nr:2-oxo-4-hydroxy-4-carboxy-5-ureidoimidazoline decarboxylase [Mesobacillus maritimus]MBY0095761.1 2-oxo-4-hydroxy-4-carboxy-5-ureidoimidazoline decarboxylase [Mesobacillus maritimus]
MRTIDELNALDRVSFIERLGGIFEHSPWVAEKAWDSKPFTSVMHLHKEMVQVVETSSTTQKLALIQSHPNLGDTVQMSEDSVNEQKGAGLTDLTPEEYAKFINMNQQYLDTFGFPFILAVRGKNKHDIYKAMEERVHIDKESEFETALHEIYKIALLRLEEKFMTNVQKT